MTRRHWQSLRRITRRPEPPAPPSPVVPPPVPPQRAQWWIAAYQAEAARRQAAMERRPLTDRERAEARDEDLRQWLAGSHAPVERAADKRWAETVRWLGDRVNYHGPDPR
jgi:hypothetical protein